MPVLAGAQIFKKQKKVPPSPLDRIHINEHFSMEYLGVVYNTLAANYNLKIHYDTAYCCLRYFSYWFMNTPVPLVIEITTHEKDLSYSIDSELVIHIKLDRQLNEEGALIVHEEPVWYVSHFKLTVITYMPADSEVISCYSK